MVSFDADVVGYQYKLGTRHPVFDICDMYAKVDMFGLGAGVFPKDKVPQVPVHPHCLCKYKVLYKGQVDLSKQVDRQKEAIAEWLDGLDKQRAIQVLGVGGYKSYIAGNDARVKGIVPLTNPADVYKNISLNNGGNNAILVVNHTTLRGEPNSVTEYHGATGRNDRNFYGADGRQYLQISNSDHRKPNQHPYGEHGEHAHDYKYDDSGNLIERTIREVTSKERLENKEFIDGA